MPLPTIYREKAYHIREKKQILSQSRKITYSLEAHEKRVQLKQRIAVMLKMAMKNSLPHTGKRATRASAAFSRLQ